MAWAAVAQAGLSLYSSMAQMKARNEAETKKATYQRERLQENINRASEARGANYVKVRQQALADTQSITESGEQAQSDADVTLAASNISGASRKDIDRQINRDIANSELQAKREAENKLEQLDFQGKQDSLDFKNEAKTIGKAGGTSTAELIAAVGGAAMAGYSQYSRDVKALTKRGN